MDIILRSSSASAAAALAIFALLGKSFMARPPAYPPDGPAIDSALGVTVAQPPSQSAYASPPASASLRAFSSGLISVFDPTDHSIRRGSCLGQPRKTIRGVEKGQERDEF